MRYQNQIIGFYKETLKKPISLSLGLMLFILVLGLALEPRERVYKNEITQKYIRTQELENRIENWEQNIQKAQKEIAENNKRISLLAEVFNTKP